MKVSIAMNYNIQGVASEQKQVIDVKKVKGNIDMKGTGTDTKLNIIAKGKIGKEKVNIAYEKTSSGKGKIIKKQGPKKQVKHFEKKCNKIAEAWEKQIKKKA